MKRNRPAPRRMFSAASPGGGAGILSLILVATGMVACGSPSPQPKVPSQRSSESESKTLPIDMARAAMDSGDWQRAIEAFTQASEASEHRDEAELGLARALLLTGQYERVEELLMPPGPGMRSVLLARALRARGKVDEAWQLLDASEPEGLVSRLSRAVLLGELLLEVGQRPAAEKPLMEAIAAYNDGSMDELEGADEARALGLVGRAAFLLRAPEDANDAFNQAEQVEGVVDPRVLRDRAVLFIDKHDYAHAEEVLSEAASAQPNHPETMILLAEVQASHSLAFDSAELLARKALEINPRHSGARFVLAGIFLRDMALTKAEEQIKLGLEVNPRDLRLLSMRAARQFLAEERSEFEATVDQVLELSPGYGKLFRIVSEYAEWEHRYEDIERLMRRAVRVDPKDGHIRAMLGLTLVRSGSDAAGVVALRRAFELDPYNVRVLNTLDLYEKIIPQNYTEIRDGPFSFRFPNEEAELLKRYVPQLAKRAHRDMIERYGYTPRAPVGIELYASRDQFAVRTSGLPRTAIQGVCFGRKLATISPQGSPANLGMTLWHELGHVFHIGLSESRVPRWLTEGLAEWETERLGVGWSRELDLSLYRALRAERLPHLDSMSRAFTRAERMEDISTAYYASGRIAHWIVDSRGKEAAVRLLSEMGKGRLAKEVVVDVLGASHEKLDEQFRVWLRKDLERFDGQFVSAEPRVRLADAKKAAADRPDDEEAQRTLGLVLLAAGEVEAAVARLEPLVEEDLDPQAAFALARIGLAKEKREEALELLKRTLAAGYDGYELRMVLARLHLALEQPKRAHEHLTKATGLDPRSAEPWSMLAALAHKAGNTEAELDAISTWAGRAEHDAALHRRHLELLLEAGENERAVKEAKTAIWAGLADLGLHLKAGQAYARTGDFEQAEYEWESALLCSARPDEKKRVLEVWAEALEKRGQNQRAREIRARSIE